MSVFPFFPFNRAPSLSGFFSPSVVVLFRAQKAGKREKERLKKDRPTFAARLEGKLGLKFDLVTRTAATTTTTTLHLHYHSLERTFPPRNGGAGERRERRARARDLVVRNLGRPESYGGDDDGAGEEARRARAAGLVAGDRNLNPEVIILIGPN